MKTHLSRVRDNRFGGQTYSTVCGRMNARSTDGINCTDDEQSVTCKFCLRDMAIKRRLMAAKAKRDLVKQKGDQP